MYSASANNTYRTTRHQLAILSSYMGYGYRLLEYNALSMCCVDSQET
jgi:hypothetical protein